MSSSKTVYGPAFSIRACRVTKSPDGLMRSAIVSRIGKRGSASVSAGMADTISSASIGGARVILATAPSAKAISSVVEGLGVNGNLLVPAAPNDPLTISVLPLIMGRRAVSGWYSDTARDSQDTLEFSALTGVHPMIEKYPLI